MMYGAKPPTSFLVYRLPGSPSDPCSTPGFCHSTCLSSVRSARGGLMLLLFLVAVISGPDSATMFTYCTWICMNEAAHGWFASGTSQHGALERIASQGCRRRKLNLWFANGFAEASSNRSRGGALRLSPQPLSPACITKSQRSKVSMIPTTGSLSNQGAIPLSGMDLDYRRPRGSAMAATSCSTAILQRWAGGPVSEGPLATS